MSHCSRRSTTGPVLSTSLRTSVMTLPPVLMSILMSIAVFGCGPSQVQTRKAPIYPCVQQSREKPARTADGKSVNAPILGWISSASFDTWIGHIDRLGQRAGIFAPDSSYREHALRKLADAMRKLGLKNSKWLDTKRPFHVVIQQPTEAQAASKKGKSGEWVMGMSAILPTLGEDQFTAAVVPEQVLKDARGHALAVNIDGKPMYYDHLNHFTVVSTAHPDRYSLSRQAAMCMHDRATGRLFDVGFAVGEAWKENKSELHDNFRDAMSKAKRPGAKPPSAEASSKLFQWLSTYVEEADVMELSAHAHEKHVSIGFAAYPYANTRSAKRLQTYRKIPDNKLVERLPKTSWWVAGQTNAFDGDVSEYEGLMGFYVDALGLDAPLTKRLLNLVKESLELTGDHSAMALYAEGRFPMAFVSIAEAKDAKALVDLSLRSSKDILDVLIQAMEKAALNKKTAKPTDAEFLEKMKKAREMPPEQWIDKLVTESANWNVKFAARRVQDGNLVCRVLRGDADVQKLRTDRRAMRVMAITGPTLEFALCNDDKHVITLMGRDVVKTAKAMLSNATPASETLGSQAAYKAIRGTGKAPTHMWMLDPAPLIERYGKALPIPLAWPQGEALGFVCNAEETAMRCEFEIPLAVVDVFRQVRAAFASFGRRKR